ncbi:MAG: hypothetical protein J6F30_08745 [Cellulosilyticum sp.]|nr:hypothetical protein [Cellulosilyticum sp.]
MSDIEFKNGFLCGLLGTALGISLSSGGNSVSNGKLPSLENLKIVNLEAYDNVATYLNISSYTTVIASDFSYMPSQGYIIIGGYDLYDFEGDDWWTTPEADLRIIIDGETKYEGDSTEFFGYNIIFDPPKTFQYKSSFEIAARRRNMSDGMQILLRETMIVGLK